MVALTLLCAAIGSAPWAYRVTHKLLKRPARRAARAVARGRDVLLGELRRRLDERRRRAAASALVPTWWGPAPDAMPFDDLPELAKALMVKTLTVTDLARASCGSRAFRAACRDECRRRTKALRADLQRAVRSAMWYGKTKVQSSCIPGACWIAIPAEAGIGLYLAPSTAHKVRFRSTVTSYWAYTHLQFGPYSCNKGPKHLHAPGMVRSATAAPEHVAAAAEYLAWLSRQPLRVLFS